MTEKIEAALTSDEWARVGPDGKGPTLNPSLLSELDYLEDRSLLQAIAIANYLLDDSDRRKITRETVESLREIAAHIRRAESNDADADDLDALADALESYLPPEE